MDKRIIRYAKLNINIDINNVQAETSKIINDPHWLPHFNRHDYEGDWTVLALRSPGGSNDRIIPDLMNNTTFSNTSLLEEFSSVKKLINDLECDVMSVRLLNLKAGANIKPHRDPELAFEKGEARIHFPVFTNPLVEFFLDDERVIMNEGESWYINANRKHKVSNSGITDRIHLVIDCKVNDWLKKVFENGEKIYADPIENDGEIRMVIEQLLLQNTETSNRLANDLMKQIGKD